MSSSLRIIFLPRLFSNSFASGDGFQLKYESSNVSHWNYSSGACGGSFSTPNGIITSPSYPGPVPRGVDSDGRGIDCGYTISRPAGTVIVLNFLSMNLHKPKISCSHRDTDYVHISDGTSRSNGDLLLAILCGDEIPGPIQSTSNNLHLQ